MTMTDGWWQARAFRLTGLLTIILGVQLGQLILLIAMYQMMRHT